MDDELLRLDSARGRWVLAATVMGSALAMLTGTVVNVALPAIGSGLGAGTSALQWVLNGYLLALASLILVGGSLGDRYGRRRAFLVGTVAFAVTTLLCGLAPTVEILVVLRVLQGAAAALLTPGSLALIESVYRPEDRGKAIGAWSALGGVAAAVGPVLGGWLVDVGSWRWAFFLNIPVAVAVVLVSLRWVPETRDAHAGRLDLLSALAALLGLGGLTWALILAPERGASATVLGPGVGGLVVLAGFLALQRRRTDPLMPLEMFGRSQFAATNAVTFVVYAALGGVFFFLVVHLQVALGYSALQAGAAILPVTALMLTLSSSAGDWAQRGGARVPLTVGASLLAVGMLLMARIGPGDGYLATVLPAVTVFGLGLAATVAPVTSAVLAAVEDRRAGIASGINNAVARTGQLVSVAVVPWIAGLRGDAIREAGAVAAGFPRAMLATAGLAAAGALLAWTTVDDTPLRRDAPGARPSPAHCAVDGPPAALSHRD